MRLAVFACFVLGCGQRAPAPAQPAAPTAPSAPSAPSAPAAGTPAETPAEARRARDFGRDYLTFLARAKTERKAIGELVALARAAGAQPLPADGPPGPGSLWWLAGPSDRAAAFIRVGGPATDGFRVVVAAVDAPRIELKQAPVSERAGLGVLDTVSHGGIDGASWLATPLALYVYAARPGARAGPLEVVVGEADADPVLTIPDLLPHLSRDVQRRAVVDSPERLDAIAAASGEALVRALAGYGIDEAGFAAAEATLVPADPPRFVGADRALIAGYGHDHRALAFAALRALIAEPAPAHTAIVIAIARSHDDAGPEGSAFARAALSRAIQTLAPAGADDLDAARVRARSAVLVARALGGELGQGLAIGPRAADALPAATRRALTAFGATEAAWQLVETAPRGRNLARELGTLDLDALDVGIPSENPGAPFGLIAVRDLYAGYLACRGWFRGADAAGAAR